MGQRASKQINPVKADSPMPVVRDQPVIETVARKEEWDAKGKWDDRSGLRAFCIMYHSAYGFLLLQANKRKKGLHYQLPGGHVDQQQLSSLGATLAAQSACARELYEETGIDLRLDLERFQLCEVAPGIASLKGRVFYWVDITDEDSVTEGTRLVKALTGENFQIALSSEHTGFAFVGSAKRAADMLMQHSGGKCSDALLRIVTGRNM